jgi:hypothetical protein
VNAHRKGLTATASGDERGRVHDSSKSLIPYVAGFALCVGAVFALVACTTPADAGAGGRDGVGRAAAVVESHGG